MEQIKELISLESSKYL